MDGSVRCSRRSSGVFVPRFAELRRPKPHGWMREASRRPVEGRGVSLPAPWTVRFESEAWSSGCFRLLAGAGSPQRCPQGLRTSCPQEHRVAAWDDLLDVTQSLSFAEAWLARGYLRSRRHGLCWAAGEIAVRRACSLLLPVRALAPIRVWCGREPVCEHRYEGADVWGSRAVLGKVGVDRVRVWHGQVGEGYEQAGVDARLDGSGPAQRPALVGAVRGAVRSKRRASRRSRCMRSAGSRR